jgi:hypothetical protein
MRRPSDLRSARARRLFVDGIDPGSSDPPTTAGQPDGWGWDWDRWRRRRG